MLTATLRACSSTREETVESLASKYLSPGLGLGPDIEVCNSAEKDMLTWAYAPGKPLSLKGMTLDVIPFLSNNGKTTSLLRSNTQRVSFDVLRGKYVLVCCVFFPIPECQCPEYYHAIKASYAQLSTRGFEMVLVPLTKTESPVDEALFMDFFDQTPGLAIPFSDVETRRNICTLLGLQSSDVCGLQTIVVDPSGRILHQMRTAEHFLHLGSDFFPFVASHTESIAAQDEVFRSRFDPFYYRRMRKHLSIKLDAFEDQPLSLHRDILQCEPSLALSRFCPALPSLTVSELGNKYVGLYICHSKDFLRQLLDAHRKCILNGQELEIIVVCLPFFMDTTTFREELVGTSAFVDIKSWLFFPDDDKVSRRLWRIFGLRMYRDRFIIVPPHCKSGELLGRLFIEQEEEYPFTRSTILEQRFTALRSLTPTLWFEGADKKHTCLLRNGSNVRQSLVRGKKLLLYLDVPGLHRDHGKLLRRLRKNYSKIKAKGWEVVFIPFNAGDVAKFDKMPWPIMPAHLAVRALFDHQLFFEEDNSHENYLIALDENGKIVSRQAKKRLRKHGVKECLFDDKLYKEIAYRLSLFRY